MLFYKVYILLIIPFIALINIFNPQLILYQTQQTTEPLNVVISLSLIDEWVENLGKEKIQTTSIVSGLENPHTYDPKPSEIQAIVSADLFIRFGLKGIEPWVNAIMDANPELSHRTLTLIDVGNTEYMEYDPLIDANNPHVWMSPIKSRDMITKIYQQLAFLDPSNNDSFYNNFLDYQNKIFDLLNRIDTVKKDVKGIKVVVHHPSFLYFFDLLGLERIGSIEEREGSEPSAAHIAEIVKKIKEVGSDNVFIINQPQLDEVNVIQIAEETGSPIVELTPLLGVEVEQGLQSKFGEFIDSYIEMFDYNLYKLKYALNKETETSITRKNVSTSFSFIEALFLMITIGFIIRRKNSFKNRDN